MRIPEQRYAVFTHTEHVSTIRRTVNAIWNQWLPASGLKAADAPNFERYDEKFDPATGNGGLEIWVPVSAIVPSREDCALRNAALRCAPACACLASHGDFVITAAKSCVWGPCRTSRASQKEPGGSSWPTSAFSPPISNFRKGRW